MLPPESRAASWQIPQAIANGVNDELSGLVDSQRVHDVGTMHPDGVCAETELRGNFLVGFAGDNVLQNLQLARGESAGTFALERLRLGQLRIEHQMPLRHALDGA